MRKQKNERDMLLRDRRDLFDELRSINEKLAKLEPTSKMIWDPNGPAGSRWTDLKGKPVIWAYKHFENELAKLLSKWWPVGYTEVTDEVRFHIESLLGNVKMPKKRS